MFRPLTFKWIRYFSICQIVFQQDDKHFFKLLLHLQQSFYAYVHFVQYLNVLSKFEQSSKDINLLHVCKIYCRKYGQHLLQQKELFWYYILKKILVQIFNNVKRCIVQKPDAVATQNWHCRISLLTQVFNRVFY